MKTRAQKEKQWAATSSGVVVLDLLCVKLNEWLNAYTFPHYADTFAAIIAGLIVIHVSAKPGLRTINTLIDSAPAGIEEKSSGQWRKRLMFSIATV